MAKGTLGYDLTNLFGLLGDIGHNEEVTDLQISNLLVKDIYDKEARRRAIMGADGDIDLYGQIYQQSKREYRRGYTAAKLSRLGYLPSSTAYTSVFDDSKVNAYVSASYNSDIKDVLRVYEGPASVNVASYFGLQVNVEWDTLTAIWTVDSNTHYNYVASTKINTTELEVLLRRFGEESILDDLIANYDYNSIDNTVTIDSIVYDVEPLNTTIIDNQYITTVIRQSDGVTEVAIFTDVEEMTEIVPSNVYDTTTMQVYFDVNSSSKTYWYLEDLDTIPPNLRSTKQLDMTAIVPVKAAGVINPDEGNLKKMLGMLGVDHASLSASLTQSNLKEVNIVYGLPFNTSNESCYKALYKTFDTIEGTNVSVSISLAQLTTKYEYTHTKYETVGVIGPVGTYTKVVTSNTTTEPEGPNNSVMTLRWQATSEEYLTIRITNFSTSFIVNGNAFTFGLDATAAEARMLIPLSVLKSLKYLEYVDVREESLSLVMFSTQTVYVEWYNTAWFNFIIIIISIILTIYTGVGGLIFMAAMVALRYVVKWLVQQGIISKELGMVILAVVAIIMIWYGGAKEGVGLLLQTVNTGIVLGQAYISYEAMQLATAIAVSSASLEEAAEKAAAIKEANDEYVDYTDVYLAGFRLDDPNKATYPLQFPGSAERMAYMANQAMVDQPLHLFELTPRLEGVISVSPGLAA